MASHANGLMAILAAVALLCMAVRAQASRENSAVDILNRTFYRVRPNATGLPTVVFCDFYIQSFGSVSEADLDFKIGVHFRMRWVDERLAFRSDEPPLLVQSVDMDRFWIPDIYFPNEKSAREHNVIRPNRNMRIFPNGTVLYSARYSLVLSCQLDLSHFPLDHQTCQMKVSTYSYSIDQLQLKWLDSDPVEVDVKKLVEPRFQLINTSVVKCSETYTTGEFACLAVQFHMRRQIGYYILQVYLPSMLIIVLSWLSFWVNKEAVPARVTLGVTTVLTMTTQLSSSKSAAMEVSYPKAIDVWFSMCMLFVFAALLEYVLVNVRWRAETEAESNTSGSGGSTGSGDEPNADVELKTFRDSSDSHRVERCRPGGRLSRRCPSRPITADAVDKYARYIFPATFFVFNVVYWTFYVRHPNHTHRLTTYVPD